MKANMLVGKGKMRMGFHRSVRTSFRRGEDAGWARRNMIRRRMGWLYLFIVVHEGVGMGGDMVASDSL
ncbi:uncharacterized protein BDV14DRAFT_175185, partial [Aspergillus stella-maris]|uniref:uncharacterized protein n=1 Tax=Aspergillus stella-maris TaxID=1810926 RepID=UPI003CCD291C